MISVSYISKKNNSLNLYLNLFITVCQHFELGTYIKILKQNVLAKSNTVNVLYRLAYEKS